MWDSLSVGQLLFQSRDGGLQLMGLMDESVLHLQEPTGPITFNTCHLTHLLRLGKTSSLQRSTPGLLLLFSSRV